MQHLKIITSESTNGSIQQPLVYKSRHNWLRLIQTSHSSYHCTSMSKLTRPGPWQLRYLIVDKEVDVLSFLTSNGVGKVVTIEPGIQPAKQIVRLDVTSVCITDSPHYSGLLCP